MQSDPIIRYDDSLQKFPFEVLADSNNKNCTFAAEDFYRNIYLMNISKYLFTSILLFSVILANGQSWDELNSRPYPKWFSDAKLGIFVHWGLYSVPAFASKEGYGEWFYRGLMVKDSGRCKIMSMYADTTLPVFEQYKELTNHWHAELWHPRDWAKIFHNAGAKYVVLVTKHHDGYCLWNSPQQPYWNSTVSGPRRNIVSELTNAVREEGLRMGFYYSLPEWSNPLHIWMQDPDSSINNYVDNYMIPQFKELVSRYKPSLIFADGDWQNTPEQFHSTELIDWYYRTVGEDAIVNDRWGQGTQHGFKTPEYSAGISDTTRPWAECRGIGRSFGLNRNEDLNNYLTDKELIQHFCELVAHGGGLTLNIGPAADGTIPMIQQERLRAIGDWLKVNGEAIYSCRPWIIPCQREYHFAPLSNSSTIDFDWVRNSPFKGMPVDNFSISWTGNIEIPHNGNYVFKIEGNDEAIVYLQDSLLLYYYHGWAENKDAKKNIHLNKGISSFKVNYIEKDLEASVRFSWSQDNGETFSPVIANWEGTVKWDKTIRCFTRQKNNLYIIEFNRPNQILIIPNILNLNKKAKIKILGTSTYLQWKQKRDGTLIINTDSVNPIEMNNLDNAWVLKVENYRK